jgi:hypothetical protein
MADNEYPFLRRSTVIRALPEIDRRKVSLVARGKRRSRQTKKGFLQVWLKKESLDTLATKNTSWSERRNGFIKRHIKGPGPLWLRNGSPSKKHLALIAWGYSPDPKRVRDWLKTQRMNKKISPYVQL